MVKTVEKRDGHFEEFKPSSIFNAVSAAMASVKKEADNLVINDIVDKIQNLESEIITVEEIQDFIENYLMEHKFFDVAKSFIIYREEHKNLRKFVKNKENFISRYRKSSNTANATIDDNSNVACRNIGVLNSEIHKEDNIQISRGMVMRKLAELYPDFNPKQYIRDLNKHIIYKHDESSFAGAIAPYCASISMYPFLTNGIKNIGGLSAFPKNIDSFCGLYINLIFSASAQFAGAIATPEFLLYFDYFARREWGDDYYQHLDETISCGPSRREKTIRKQIHQYFQQVIYSINQPSGARGLQSAFVNFSYYDKPFFESMFGEFVFPDGTKPIWESLSFLQKDFMMWFNEERLKSVITFPVESFALIYKDGKFVDEDSFKFVCEEYERGHSFFTYISDTVDSLSSCCRLKNKIQTKEFSYTLGNLSLQTGSKSVITTNLSRIIQDFCKKYNVGQNDYSTFFKKSETFKRYLVNLLERVYKYHTAYNELLHENLVDHMLPIYEAGFINLDKQYLTIGINGLNQAAEFLGLRCSDNEDYSKFCQLIFSTIKDQNITHKTKTLTFNTECVPAESLAIKNYNWDKADGYWVPEDTNLYASYIFKPNDNSTGALEKLRMHGSNYIGDYLDGGSAAHINLDEHLSKAQYEKILTYSAQNGCQYLTFNIPMSECNSCGKIVNRFINECPECGSKKISYYSRPIGYLTKIDNWSDGRQKEFKTRIFHHIVE